MADVLAAAIEAGAAAHTALAAFDRACLAYVRERGLLNGGAPPQRVTATRRRTVVLPAPSGDAGKIVEAVRRGMPMGQVKRELGATAEQIKAACVQVRREDGSSPVCCCGRPYGHTGRCVALVEGK